MVPPIFSKFRDDQALLKGQIPSTKRRTSLGGSSPCLGISTVEELRPKATGRRSSINVTMPVSNDKNDTKGERKKDDTKSTAPPTQANSADSVSYEEEEVVDEEYEEEVIVDEEYYEEEIIEEVVIEDLNLPERETTIKFDEFDEMQTALHINDYTAGEIEKTWYGRPDYDKMVQKARSTVSKAEANEAAKNKPEKKSKSGKEKRKSKKDKSSSEDGKKKVLDVRGLEGWSTAGSLAVRSLKERAVEAVWNEQNRQWDTGVRDAEKLRDAYQTVSVEAQAEAEARAAGDAVAAEKIHAKDGNKSDQRRLLKKNKSIFAKSMRVAKKKVKKAVAGKKTKGEEQTDKREIYRQPSQVSRLVLENVDGKSFWLI